MKLFTKAIDKMLFDQYKYGSDLSKQKVVAKIFNPYGRGTWYLLNSDPEDPDYLWCIVDMYAVETGSASRSELESVRVPPFRLPLERDISFDPIPAEELFKGLLQGKHYAEGGEIEEGEGGEESENAEMLYNQLRSVQHHAKELGEVLSRVDEVEPWVITKMQRAVTDIADVTHYLDGEHGKYAKGGQLELFDINADQPFSEYTLKALKPLTYYVYETPKVSILWNGKVQPFGMFTSVMDAWDYVKLKANLSDITSYAIQVPGELLEVVKKGSMAEGGITNDQIEEARENWAKIARKNGWYEEPFHVIVWHKDGEVVDSVSHRGLDKDYILEYEEDEDDYADGGMMARGGKMKEGVDLFEDPESIPDEVHDILDEYLDTSEEEQDYSSLQNAQKELEKIGYTFDWGLDGVPYNLRKIGQKGKHGEEYEGYAKGGRTKWIQSAIKKPGALRATAKRMGLIQGDEKLSKADLLKLIAKGGKTAQRARLALTLSKYADGGQLYPDLSAMQPGMVNEPSMGFDKKKTEADAAKLKAKIKTLKKLLSLMETTDKNGISGTIPEVSLVMADSGVTMPDKKIQRAFDAVDILHSIWDTESLKVNESMYVLLLNTSNKVIGYAHHSKGGITATVLDRELIIAMAVKALAKGVIVAHNHPSGNLIQSNADEKVSRELQDGLKTVGITLVDSIIVVPNSKQYLSLSEQGII